jgi:hypothetical protein
VAERGGEVRNGTAGNAAPAWIFGGIIAWAIGGISPRRTQQWRAAIEEFARRTRPEKKAKGWTAIERLNEVRPKDRISHALASARIELD